MPASLGLAFFAMTDAMPLLFMPQLLRQAFWASILNIVREFYLPQCQSCLLRRLTGMGKTQW
jgi:hypothetical protein